MVIGLEIEQEGSLLEGSERGGGGDMAAIGFPVLVADGHHVPAENAHPFDIS
jgi:hypothetical protein